MLTALAVQVSMPHDPKQGSKKEEDTQYCYSKDCSCPVVAGIEFVFLGPCFVFFFTQQTLTGLTVSIF
jgi:hypothetical protein